MSVVIAIILIYRFRDAIDSFLKRLVEGNFFGQQFKAVPPSQLQRDTFPANRDGLATALPDAALTAAMAETIPADLAQDPNAQAAIGFVRTNPVQTVVEYMRLSFNYNSERLFNRIYGTQIALLTRLSIHPEQSVKLSQLVEFHETHQTISGRTDYQIRDYIQFLISFGVVSRAGALDDSDFRITQQGIQFLSYIKANYPTLWNQRTF